MTADAIRPDMAPAGRSVVEELIGIAGDRFSGLGYVAPDGVLDLSPGIAGVSSIRVELTPGRPLGLQSVGIEADGVDDIAGVARVRASSWSEDGKLPFEPARLFDFDLPRGPQIRTGADSPAWLEVMFTRPLTVRRIRLRNVSDEDARHARGAIVTARTRWRTRRVWDGAEQERAWRGLAGAARTRIGGDPEAIALLDVLDLTVRGAYRRAHRTLGRDVGEAARRWFQTAVNAGLLAARGLEWTVHGPRRSFRSWSEPEQIEYIRESARLVETLRSLTANVCLGFGSVLSVVRDRALIPHDDDLDVIIAFERDEAATLGDGLRRIEGHLRPLGYDVTGAFAAHRHVRRAGGKPVDVFVGVFEGEAISWYPGARRGLTRDIVFPAGPAELLGVPCMIPAQPEVYLERLYGEGWRVPDPHFRHAWDLPEYADITGTPTASDRGPTAGRDEL